MLKLILNFRIYFNHEHYSRSNNKW